MASGLGYGGVNPVTKEPIWDYIYSITILDVELGNSPNIMMQSWNHQIHIWLKYYVYNRLLVPGKRAGFKENMATFCVSAFWHGFYPSYYIMFFFTAMFSELARDVYRSRSLFEFIPYPINSFIGN